MVVKSVVENVHIDGGARSHIDVHRGRELERRVVDRVVRIGDIGGRMTLANCNRLSRRNVVGGHSIAVNVDGLATRAHDGLGGDTVEARGGPNVDVGVGNVEGRQLKDSVHPERPVNGEDSGDRVEVGGPNKRVNVDWLHTATRVPTRRRKDDTRQVVSD